MPKFKAKAREVQEMICILKRFMFILLICINLFITSTTSIQINYIKVPTAVKNNTKNAVILDCNYSVRPDDTELTVKWYLDEEVIYQWIPPQKPQSLGIFKDRIDLKYKVTDDPKTEFRAIKIKHITTNISGEYKCLVSTLADEDSSTKSMIVFEPERNLVLTKTKDQDFINFTCLVSDVYPSPRLHLYKDIKNDFRHRIRLSAVEWDTKINPKNGRYTMFIVASEPFVDLTPGTLVHCDLKIPGTGYVRTKSILYYPEYMHRVGGKPHHSVPRGLDHNIKGNSEEINVVCFLVTILVVTAKKFKQFNVL